MLLSSPNDQSWYSVILLALVVYSSTVRLLRYRRSDALIKKYAPAGQASFQRLSNTEAQAVLKNLAELEFPALYGASMVIANIRTYGIPSISSVLVQSGQLGHVDNASKRAADTGVLLLEFGLNKPTSKRAIEAVARMNYLHSKWQRAGKIMNDDMLYTLSLFALEAMNLINRYEWRCFTDLEVCATGTYWRSMGDAMDISYNNLPSYKDGWNDGVHWLGELRDWAARYENAHMVPAKTNRQCGDSFFRSILPGFAPHHQDTFKEVASVLLGKRLRTAMMYHEPRKTYTIAVESLLLVRKMLLRHFSLPRPHFLRFRYIDESSDSTGCRHHMKHYLAQPWYVKPTIWARWGPRALLSRALGMSVPGDEKDKYFPEGYAFDEIGPETSKGRGAGEMDEMRERLTRKDRGGCPF